MKRSYFLVLIVIGFLQQNINAQGFIYGVNLDKWDATNQLMYEYVGDSLKMNTIVHYADGDNTTQRDMVSRFNLIAAKSDNAQDAVMHYSQGYYTRWEAEDTTIHPTKTGMKANYGSSVTYQGVESWTSGTNEINAGNVLLWGPNYRQDKEYRLNHMTIFPLEFILKVRLAGEYIIPQFSPLNEPVCKISVVFTYKEDGIIKNETLESITILDNWLSEEFNDTTLTYSYPSEFVQYSSKMSSLNQENILSYDDMIEGTGIQFQVTWYGLMKIYVDKFEVYDQRIGDEIVNDYQNVVEAVSNFVNKYNGWNNILYFFNLGEPQTIDMYTPARIVDEILDSLNAPKGIGEFYPQWDGWRNGDRTIKKFTEMAQPEKVMAEFINYYLETPGFDIYEQQRFLLQELHEHSPDFWYEPMIARLYNSLCK